MTAEQQTIWDEEEQATCPSCGHTGSLDEDFEVGGCCLGQILCGQCSQEFDSVSGKEHDHDKCPLCSELFKVPEPPCRTTSKVMRLSAWNGKK